MDISLAWLIAGFILIIVELVTGTFYLLVLGIAALVGAGVGYASGGFVGQPAAFDSWVNRSAGHARVKYRDALWDAQVAGDASGEPGEILYITSVDGSTLKVSKTRPA